MNDRFKFRGYWYNDTQKEWRVFDKPEFITGDGTAEIWCDSEGGAYPELPSYADLHLCQCTGLKDKNGKLIYEGDVVTVDYDLYDCLYNEFIGKKAVITYREEIGRYNIEFEPQDNSGSNIFDLVDDPYYFLKWEPCGKLQYGVLNYIEVIGNIYENKELLESER